MSDHQEANSVANNIKKARKSMMLSQAELAERLHVSRQTVSNWECGVSVPDVKSLEMMQDIFKVSVQDLLGQNLENGNKALQQSKEDIPYSQEAIHELISMNAFYASEIKRLQEREQKVRKWTIICVAVLLLIYVLVKIYFRPSIIRIHPVIEETFVISTDLEKGGN
ncbi:MAG: helix-turn-helix transcriptional regulator [Eubacteriales bacterium]|nr:helix-turn-helix transcriptional regulator [Eubacteriales bacterium]